MYIAHHFLLCVMGWETKVNLTSTLTLIYTVMNKGL